MILGFFLAPFSNAQPFPGFENIRSLENQGNGFCFSVAFLDVDEDGIEDLLFGQPFDDGEFNTSINSGALLVVSGQRSGPGRPRLLLREIFNPDATSSISLGSGFGLSIATSGAVPGQPIVLVGAPGTDHPDDNRPDVGAVYFFAGPNLDHMATLYGEGARDRLGTSVAVLEDLDGDGLPEFAAGAPGHDSGANNAGRVLVLRPRGRALQPLATIDGSSVGQGVGNALATGGTFHPGGSSTELGIGASENSEVLIADPRTGVVLQTLKPPGGIRAGTSLIFVEDQDLDGLGEIAIGDPGRGRVTLHTTTGGSTPLWSLRGRGSTEAEFGSTLQTIADVDANGFSELLVGAPNHAPGEREGAGGVALFQLKGGGQSPELAWGEIGRDPGDRLGYAMAAGRVQDAAGVERTAFLLAAPVAAGDNVVSSGTATLWGVSSQGPELAVEELEAFHGSYSGISSFAQQVVFRRRHGVPDDWIVTSTAPDRPDRPEAATGYSTGRVFVLSGASEPIGKIRHVFTGKTRGEGFGAAVTAVSGNRFGGNDRFLIVGVPAAVRNGIRSGVVRIYDLVTGEMTFEYAPRSAGSGAEFGLTVARLGQIFGLRQTGQNGREQVAIGAPGARSQGLAQAGAVYVYTMTDEGTLELSSEKILRNRDTQARAGDRFGSALAGPQTSWQGNSVARNQPPGLLVGAPYADLRVGDTVYRDAGRVFVYGVNQGYFGFVAPLVADNLSFPADPSDDFFGTSVAGAGDLRTGGGFEFVVGSPGAECGGFSNVGRVTVYQYTHGYPNAIEYAGVCALPQATACPRAARGALFGWSLSPRDTPFGVGDGFFVGAPGFRSPITGRPVGRVWGFGGIASDPPCLLFEEMPRPDESVPELGNDSLFANSIAWSVNPALRPGEQDLEGRLLIAAPFQDVFDGRAYRENQPRLILDLGRAYMLPLEKGRPRE